VTLDELVQDGIRAVNEGRHHDAVRVFTDAVARAPERPDLHNALGMAYLHLSDVDAALPHLRRAVEVVQVATTVEGLDAEAAREHLIDMHVHFAEALASTLEATDQAAEAARVLRDVVAAVPDATQPRVRLGRLLLACGDADAALPHLQEVADDVACAEEVREAAGDLADAVRQFVVQEVSPLVFLEAHAAEYRAYFDEVVQEVGPDHYAEAARMVRGPDGQPTPMLDPAARPYAYQRVDIVDPRTGNVSDVCTNEEPMIVGVEGFDTLAAVPVLFELQRAPFRVLVSSQCPWHWLQIVVAMAGGDVPAALAQVDGAIGHWYLAGYQGEFGTREGGRFHYISDPEPAGPAAVAYHVDLGRASFSAIDGLMRVLAVLHDRAPIDRVVIGVGFLA
jgi:hypothetical protein